MPRDKQQQIQQQIEQQQQKPELVWEKRLPNTVSVGETVDFKAHIKLGNLTLLPIWEVEPAGTVAVLGELLYAIQEGTVTLQAYMPTPSKSAVGEKVTIVVEKPLGVQTGSISGIVLDQSAVPVANATVQALQDSTVKASSTTNTVGQFLLENLPAGNYTVVAKQAGLEAKSSVKVEAGKTAFVTIQLSPIQQDNPVSIAKSIVQMLRDFGMTTKSTFENEPMNIRDAITRLAFPTRVIGDSLIGQPPARYREVQDEQGNLILQKVGDVPDSRTWIVESTVSGSEGLRLTVNAEHDADFFDPQSTGRITFSVRSLSHPSLRYDGTLTFDSNGMSGSVEIREDKLLANFTGSLTRNSVQGNLQYQSDTLTFTGSVSCNWENEEILGFGSELSPVQISEVPKGMMSLQGNWAPNIGRPAGIEFQMTSNPQGNAPHVTIQLTINYGDQKLSGTIAGTLDIRNSQSYGFKSGNLDMIHSPSNFKVRVSAERGKPVSGQIVDAQGQKVADIGEARNLGLPDLGSALIVKYTDGTFETLESVLPRSRLGRK